MNTQAIQKPHSEVESEVDLSQFDDEYADIEIEKREFEPIPDGKYQVNVDRVEITPSKSSGRDMLKWTLRVLGPQYRNRLLWRNNMLASRENIKWLKQDLTTCGLHLAKVSELPRRLEELLDTKLEITKRTKGDYENVYFNRRIVTDDGVLDDEEDMPF